MAVLREGVGAPADVSANEDLSLEVLLGQLLEGQRQDLEVIGGVLDQQVGPCVGDEPLAVRPDFYGLARRLCLHLPGVLLGRGMGRRKPHSQDPGGRSRMVSSSAYWWIRARRSNKLAPPTPASTCIPAGQASNEKRARPAGHASLPSGRPELEITEALDLTKGSIAPYIRELRDASEDLPYRRPPRGAAEVAARRRRRASSSRPLSPRSRSGPSLFTALQLDLPRLQPASS